MVVLMIMVVLEVQEVLVEDLVRFDSIMVVEEHYLGELDKEAMMGRSGSGGTVELEELEVLMVESWW
jgi:hypothetical protein